MKKGCRILQTLFLVFLYSRNSQWLINARFFHPVFFVKTLHRIIYSYFLFFLQAEEITLTIGQAFELAYKKFLESKGKDLEKEKKEMVMHKRIELLENENKELKKRLTDIANIKGDNDVKQYMRENNVSAFTIKITQKSKLYIPSTINIWKKLLSTAIWAGENGLFSGRIACILSKNLRSETI